MVYLVILITSLILSLLTVKLSQKLAFRLKVVSLPNPRKIHSQPMPLLGGLGIFFGWSMALLLARLLHILPEGSWTRFGYFVAGLLIIMITGLLDDTRGLNSKQKFGGEFLAALSLAIGGCVIEAFVAPGGSRLSLGVFSYLFTLLWIVFVVNSVNLLDGLDGLAAGVSAISLAGFALIAWHNHATFLVVLALVILGSLLGFLKYNFHPASIFMGDTGSLQLGYVLAYFSIETLRVANSHQIYFLSSLIILGVPITDTLISFFRRLGQGEHPFKADKEHVHHRILKLGLSHPQTVSIMLVFGLFLTGLGVLMTIYTEFVGLLLFILGLAVALFVAWRLGYLEARQYIPMGITREENLLPTQPPLHWNRIWHQILILLADVVAINMSLYLVYWFKFQSGVFAPLTIRSLQEFWTNPVFLIFTIAWIVIFWLTGLYNMAWDISRFDKSLRVTKIITLGIVLLGLLLSGKELFFEEAQISILVFYWLSMVLLVNGSRLMIIEIEKRLHALEYSFKNTLIVGANPRAQNLIQDIKTNPHLLYKLVAVVDGENPTTFPDGLPVFSGYDRIPEIVHAHKVEEVIITLGEEQKEDLLKVIGMCDQMRVVMKTLPGLHKLVSGRNPELAGHSLVKIFPENMVMWQWMVKRLMDYLFALSNLLLLFPVWVPLSLWVRFHFRKSVFVKVPALGKNGQIFSMLLFRVTADDYDYQKNSIYLGRGPTEDLSVLGRLLYFTRLYKFPIILNILKGDMSLVGPRPEPREWYQQNYDRLNFLHRRLLVRPGFTGLAQVKFRYESSQKDFQERINYDIFYIENMSINLDLRIILRSLFLFFKRPNKQIEAVL